VKSTLNSRHSSLIHATCGSLNKKEI